MFARRHSRGWSQDDFWDRHYNPIRAKLCWEDILLTPGRLDETTPADRPAPATTYRAVIARNLRQAAERVEQMAYPTYKEFLARNPERTCPICEQVLDVD